MATCGVLASGGIRRSLLVAALALAACSSDRGDGPSAFPGATPPPTVLEPGTVPPGYQPYVDGLAANFVDGGRLVARLDERQAACVAERWIGLLDPAALQAAGLQPERMRDATLADLTSAVPVERDVAEAMTASFRACGADHTEAFLDSLLLTSEITPSQRVCLEAALPDGLISAITVSVLTEEQLDDELAGQYERALDACPRS